MHRLMHGAYIHLFLQDAFVCCPTQSGRWIKTQRSSNISIAMSEGSAEGYSLTFTGLLNFTPTVARLLQNHRPTKFTHFMLEESY